MTCAGCEARDRSIAGLTEELAAWRDRDRREQLSDVALERRERWRRALAMTAAEAVMLLALVDRRGAGLTREALLDHHLAARPVARREDPDLSVIGVYVWRVRNKLRPHGFGGAIKTRYGAGFFIEQGDAARIAAFVGEVDA